MPMTQRIVKTMNEISILRRSSALGVRKLQPSDIIIVTMATDVT